MIKSPCIEVCRMDERLGLCLGCLRTLDEISRWSQMSEADKRQVLARVADRRDELGERQLVEKQRI